MAKATIKPGSRMQVSEKISEYIKKQPPVNISLKDIQQSLSNIGVSLSRRVIEHREKR